ncbi:heavy metal-binding domain-containing protein (plasmid) [Novosphingobium sp. BL-8A]|uniref:heavy metal-binding domain-containing protein n=1 Tax=Novosphingobium sp. BL-8A TaxID=3127639 RepID=UPI003756A0ED
MFASRRLLGATNTSTGMAFKVNSGESTARSILVTKAAAMGANCIIGVDVDYGTTANNAATVNMQGTAVTIRNLEAILDDDVMERFGKFEASLARAQEISRWLAGEFGEE